MKKVVRAGNAQGVGTRAFNTPRLDCLPSLVCASFLLHSRVRAMRSVRRGSHNSGISSDERSTKSVLPDEDVAGNGQLASFLAKICKVLRRHLAGPPRNPRLPTSGALTGHALLVQKQRTRLAKSWIKNHLPGWALTDARSGPRRELQKLHGRARVTHFFTSDRVCPFVQGL